MKISPNIFCFVLRKSKNMNLTAKSMLFSPHQILVWTYFCKRFPFHIVRNFLGSALPQQKFEMMVDQCYSSVLLTSKGKGVRAGWLKRHKEKRSTPHPPDLDQFWLLFLYVFLLPVSLSYINWASQEGCLFFPRSSLQSSDLSLFCFLGLSLLCLLATVILDSFFLF